MPRLEEILPREAEDPSEYENRSICEKERTRVHILLDIGEVVSHDKNTPLFRFPGNHHEGTVIR